MAEELARLRVLGEVVEDRLAVDLLEGGPACLNAVEQLAPGPVLKFTSHGRQCFHRWVQQALCQGRPDEAALFLSKDADACQRP